MLQNLKDKHFIQRKSASDEVTYALTQLLEKLGHWKIERYATSEEDQEELVDLYVEYPDKPGIIKPVQFKVRTDPKYRDFIVARYQPCYGLDHEVVNDPRQGKTCNGRDWRGLLNKKSFRYYVATLSKDRIFDEISWCKSDVLCRRVKELDTLWEEVTVKNKFKFTSETIDKMMARGVPREKVLTHTDRCDEVWYQKNYGERPKFLMYIDNAIREGYVSIHNEVNELESLKQQFKETQCTTQ